MGVELIPAQVKTYPGVKVFGGSDKVAALTDKVVDGDELQVGSNIKIK